MYRYSEIINGVRGVGMSEGMRSIFQTRPPRRIPVILSAEEAAAADFDALSSDWAKVCGDLSDSYEKEIGFIHV